MNRHLNWMDKPITWRAYLKLASICAVIGTAISGGWCVLLMEPAWWKATKNFLKKLFNR